MLKEIFSGTNVKYSVLDKKIILSIEAQSPEQEKKITVSGTISDAQGEPIIGASVLEKGVQGNGTITDIDGNFKISVSSSKAQLDISYIGYQSQTVAVQPGKNMKIILQEDSKQLDEVVVVGYGTQSKKTLTGAVSMVNMGDVEMNTVPNVSRALAGKAAGFRVNQVSAQPGGEAKFRIRGEASTGAGNEPLFVIDGFPVSSTSNLSSGNGFYESGNIDNVLESLNPDDIESIDILKDASATAIYGARGANGVIMITTKKGSEGQAKVSYSAYASVSELPNEYEVLSADQYRAFASEKGITIDDGGANTNWQDEIFRTALSHNHNLAVSGGGKKGNYRASLSFQDQEGIIKKSGMKKYTGRFYLSQKTFNDKLLFEASLMATRTKDKRAPLGQSGGYEGDLLLTALKVNPTYPVFNEDGTYYQKSQDVRNPVAMIDLTNDNTETDRILANVTGTLDLWKGLKYKMNVAFDETKASRKVTQDKQLIYMSDKGTANINNVEASNFLIENYLTYDFKVKDIHKFNLLAGHSYQKFRNYWYGFSETGFDIDNIDYLYDLSFGKNTDITGTSNITVNELQSFFGRVNYDYKGRYLFEASGRYDGTSRFPKDSRFGSSLPSPPDGAFRKKHS